MQAAIALKLSAKQAASKMAAAARAAYKVHQIKKQAEEASQAAARHKNPTIKAEAVKYRAALQKLELQIKMHAQDLAKATDQEGQKAKKEVKILSSANNAAQTAFNMEQAAKVKARKANKKPKSQKTSQVKTSKHKTLKREKVWLSTYQMRQALIKAATKEHLSRIAEHAKKSKLSAQVREDHIRSKLKVKLESIKDQSQLSKH